MRAAHHPEATVSPSSLPYPKRHEEQIDNHLLDLSQTHCLTRTTRPERTALIQWRMEGEISRGFVQRLVVDEHGLSRLVYTTNPENYAPDVRAEVEADTEAIWDRLHRLANGEVVFGAEFPQRPSDFAKEEDRLAAGRTAGTQLMRELDRLLSSKVVPDSELPDLLHPAVIAAIETVAVRNWLHTPQQVGQILAGWPTNPQVNAFGDDGLLALAQLLAGGVMNGLSYYYKAEHTAPVSPSEEVRTTARQTMKEAVDRLNISWLLLKGFVFRGSRSQYDRLAMLAGRQADLVDVICVALVEGQSFLSRLDPAVSTEADSDDEPVTVDTITTPELVADFRQVVLVVANQKARQHR